MKRIWKIYLQLKFLLFKTSFSPRRVSLMDMIQILRLTITQKYSISHPKTWERVKNNSKKSNIQLNPLWRRVIINKIVIRITLRNLNWQYLNHSRLNNDRSKDKQKRQRNHHQNIKMKINFELRQHLLLSWKSAYTKRWLKIKTRKMNKERNVVWYWLLLINSLLAFIIGKQIKRRKRKENSLYSKPNLSHGFARWTCWRKNNRKRSSEMKRLLN